MVLGALALIALALRPDAPSKVVVNVPEMPRRIVPRTELPAVEPVRIVALSQSDAKTYNDSIPFSTLPNPGARPFRLTAPPDARARAIDCLAAAAIYEAGDDPVGEEAVIQVVLNRVRHPAFPKTVCGVVFQGSERTTGCQFTFTCDGALARAVPERFWLRARGIAIAALDGTVFAPVGNATHYHTDQVVPYWQASLDKVTAVNTHLFFRWTGWWGTPAAFRHAPDPDEPAIEKLALYSPAHRAARVDVPLLPEDESLAGGPASGAVPPPVALPKLDPGLLKGSSVRVADPRVGTFLVLLDPAAFPGSYAVTALATCQKRTACTVYGYLPADGLPDSITAAERDPSRATFVYRSRLGTREEALWNCARVARPSPAQCMPGTASSPRPRPAPSSSPAAAP
jgi:hypothetical protein